MTAYSTDDIDTANNDLATVETLAAMLSRFKDSIRHVGRHLVLNKDEIEAFCRGVDDVFSDSLGCVGRLAISSGAEQTRSEYLPQILLDARSATLMDALARPFERDRISVT